MPLNPRSISDRPRRLLEAGLCALFLVAAGASGCGPVNANTAVNDAETWLDEAKKARAHRLAPYSYWLAVSYLQKAKVTEGYSEFQAAEEFALRAREHAENATKEAREERERQQILQERLKGRRGGG